MMANFRNVRGIPIAGKTGTSQQGRDSGFVGYTPYFTGAVWLGFDMPRPLPNNFTRYREGLWRTIMERVHYGLPPASFERPSGVFVGSVCRDSGRPAGPFCQSDPRGSRIVSDLFASSVGMPSGTCHVHQQRRICDVSGLLAGDSCHPALVSYRVGMYLDPLPDWARGIHVPGRQYAFTNEVLQGHVCVNCQYHLHEYFHPEEPDEDEPYNDQPPQDNSIDWPWNILQPTPPPSDYDYPPPYPGPGTPPYEPPPYDPPSPPDPWADPPPYNRGYDYQNYDS